MISYLSPSGISLYRENPEEFYFRYIAQERKPREPQNQPMSIGSSFDAYVKSYLHNALYGPIDPRFELATLFEAQVEPQLRDWAFSRGGYCFEQYKSSGALGELLLDMQTGASQRFEFEVSGVVNGYREGKTTEIAGVTLLGKPDASYVNTHGQHIILDWKVNGFCSNYPVSPKPGYLKLRRAGGINEGKHKNCAPMLFHGTLINMACKLEDVDGDWARQLSVYSWLLGEPVGGEQVFAIEQLACSPVPGTLPRIRVASHRYCVSQQFQQSFFEEIVELWHICQSDHFFRHLTLPESQARCELLRKKVARMRSGESELMNFLSGRE